MYSKEALVSRGKQIAEELRAINPDHPIELAEERWPELAAIAEEIAQRTIFEVNRQTSLVREHTEARYIAQAILEMTIARLQRAV